MMEEREASSESERTFVSVAFVVAVLFRASTQSLTALAFAGLALLTSCGPEGPFPTTVDPGPDFSIAEITFDEGFFYCQVEPRTIIPSGCSNGMPGEGCHASVTSFRLRDHAPIACNGNTPTDFIPSDARQNYTGSNARMRRDPDVAPLLQRPLKKLAHPRQIFDEDSDSAQAIREWATRVTTQ
jgi:hypothetical protein